MKYISGIMNHLITGNWQPVQISKLKIAYARCTLNPKVGSLDSRLLKESVT